MASMTKAEPRVQPMFIKSVGCVPLILAILGMAHWLINQPNRSPGPDRIVAGEAAKVLAGKGLRAWHLTADDARFGGLSALAVQDGELIALTDSGVVVRFVPPALGSRANMAFALHDLPDGPGSALQGVS